jgi:hypothetical protein
MKPGELYDVKETAELLHVSVWAVRDRLAAGKLKASAEKPKILISVAEILRYLQEKADAIHNRRWVECKGCEYYRNIPGTSYTFCHYCVDTGILRGIHPRDCYLHEGTPYKPKARKKRGT